MRRISQLVTLGCLAASLTVGLEAHAQPRARSTVTPARTAPVRARRVRDWFSGTLLFGGTLGVGSPRGIAGGFIEYRPWRFFGISAGGGAGGAFGPSVDVTALLAPIGGKQWAIGAEASLSYQFNYWGGAAMPGGRTMPDGSTWASTGATLEVRPSRTSMIRLGGGRAWLLNTREFGVLRSNELDAAQAEYGVVPGVTPLDAARSALAGETLAVWYVHVDIGVVWRL